MLAYLLRRSHGCVLMFAINNLRLPQMSLNFLNTRGKKAVLNAAQLDIHSITELQIQRLFVRIMPIHILVFTIG